MDCQRTARMPGSDADHRGTAPAAGPRRVRRPLQHCPAAPGAAAEPARRACASACGCDQYARAAPRPARRPDPRIFAGRRATGFPAPTGHGRAKAQAGAWRLDLRHTCHVPRMYLPLVSGLRGRGGLPAPPRSPGRPRPPASASAECQDREAEYPANQQVDDLEQHPAGQPSLRPGCG